MPKETSQGKDIKQLARGELRGCLPADEVQGEQQTGRHEQLAAVTHIQTHQESRFGVEATSSDFSFSEKLASSSAFSRRWLSGDARGREPVAEADSCQQTPDKHVPSGWDGCRVQEPWE